MATEQHIIDRLKGKTLPDLARTWAMTRSFRATLLLLVMLVAAGFRLYLIELEAPWYDEALTVRHIGAPSLTAYLERAFDQDPYLRISPVYYILQYLWAGVFGASVLSLRLLSVTLGVATLAPLYGLGRRFFGTRAALLGGLALALSLVHVYYSQEIRFYALLVLLAAGSMAALTRALHEGGARWWLLHIALNALLLWTHSFAALLFVPQGLYLLACHRRHTRQWLGWGAAHVGIVLAFYGFMRVIGYDALGRSTYYQDYPGGWRELANAFLVFTGGRYNNLDPSPFLPPHNVSFDLLIGALFLLLAGVLAWTAWQDRQTGTPPPARVREGLILLAVWWLVPVLLLYGLSQFWRPVFYYRYVLFSALPVYLIIGAGIMGLRNPRVRLGVALALFVALGYQNLALVRPLRPSYVRAAQHIAHVAAPNSLVFPFKHINALPFRTVSGMPDDRIVLHEGYGELIDSVIEATGQGHEVWVLFYLWNRVDDFIARMEKAGRPVESPSFPGAATLTLVRVLPDGHEEE
jgi:mannosyltransferase